jgi:hypothetical protein
MSFGKTLPQGTPSGRRRPAHGVRRNALVGQDNASGNRANERFASRRCVKEAALTPRERRCSTKAVLYANATTIPLRY